METSQEMNNSKGSEEDQHPLYKTWVLWGHMPHDTDWSLKSYIQICEVDTIEKVTTLFKNIPDKMIKNSMLFYMKKGINPTWEDKENRDGGCFSFKISNKNVVKVFKTLTYLISGNTISNDLKFLGCVNGLTISPKKSFCIIKIWMKNLTHQNSKKINMLNELNIQGTLFKRHNPEY